jgi:hypothetical protein
VDCKNCHTELQEQDDYCKSCGGRVIRNRLTFKNLFEHISETFFNYDNKLLRTIIDLFRKPETVIGGYINGMRKRYVNPISYIALSITVGGIYMFVLNKYFPDAMTAMTGSNVEGQEVFMNSYMSFIQKYYSFVMIALIPVYALVARLVFVNKKEFNYTEHIIMCIYIMAQFSLISSFLNIILLVLQLPPDILGTASIFLQMAFFGYCYKRLYKLSLSGLILRTLFFLAIVFVLMIGLVLIGFVVGYIYKDSDVVQGFIESQKAAIEAQKAIKDSIN